MSITSPYYWLAIVVLASSLAVAIRVVRQDRVELRVYRAALAVYVLLWVAVGTVTASPLFFGSLNVMPNGWPPLWAGLPLALVVGTVAIVVGGHLIAWLFGIRTLLLHPRHVREAWRSGRHPAYGYEGDLTAEELRTAEDYDAEWQRRDRERNRRLGIGPGL